jgi:dihydrolipoamide dehydrogenase
VLPVADAPTFDLVVIGSGPGGYVAAVRAAQLGLQTAVVERDSAGCGGTCLQRGCIPTKALLHTADLLEDLRKAASFGIHVENLALDFPAVMQRKERIVRRLSRGIETYLFKKHKIAFFKGVGRLAGSRTVVVQGEEGEQRLNARNVLIATGSRPKTLPGVELDGIRILSSDHLLELKQMPQSLTVLGAGAVGIEFASVFARFGATVTVLELLPRVLPLEDEEISVEAAMQLSRHMTIHTGAKVESARADETGVETTFAAADGSRMSVRSELLLVAVGRGPVTDGLGLETTGVRLAHGYVRVNARLETDEPGVHAIGDVITVDGAPHPQLAHVASHEGIFVAERLAGKEVEAVNYDRVPSATYCSPEVASVGLSESAAKKRGHDVRVGRFNFGSLAKPRILGHESGLVKVVTDAKYDEVLGIHMVGPHATDLIAEACVALRLEATAAELAATMHPHPTLSEALMQAAEAVYGMAIDA